MIIAFDIGNTHIVTGILDNNGTILCEFRVASKDNLTEDEFFSILKNISDFNSIKLENIKGIVISSVVPSLTSILVYLSKNYFNIEPMIINADLKLPISFDVDNPNELGADRLVSIVEAQLKYPDKNLVVIDFGTATTFDVLKNRVYAGGCILPGINLSLNALVKGTAKLPNIRLEKPKSVFGKNTAEHINAGIYFGTIGQIKEILNKIREDIPDIYIITTGGLANNILNDLPCIDEYIHDLILKGLFSIYKYNVTT